MLDQTIISFISDEHLAWIHIILATWGFLIAILVMAYIGHEREDRDDPIWMQWTRRFSYMVLALGMIWSIKYQLEIGWHSWPPEIAIILAIDIMISLRGVAIQLRIKREGHRRSSIPRAMVKK